MDVGGDVPADRRGAPTPSSVGVARRMSRQARVDTGPELALRRLLHADGGATASPGRYLG